MSSASDSLEPDEGLSRSKKEQPSLSVRNVVEVREWLNQAPTTHSLPPHTLMTEAGKYLILGFDTEYQPISDVFTQKDVKAGTARYEVLSYQFYAINHLGDHWDGLIIPNDGERISLTEFIVFALAKGAAHNFKLPNNIVLVGHFNKADVPAFEERKQLFDNLHNIRNSLVSLGQPVPISIRFDQEQHEEICRVHIRDTILLAPATSRSLLKLGKLIDVPKFELDSDPAKEIQIKERMRVLRGLDFDLFRDYAIRDAEVCAKYFERVAQTYQQVTEKSGIPTALSSIGMSLLLKDWLESGIDSHEVIGREMVEEVVYDETHHQLIQRKTYPYVDEVSLFEQLATECYHGGRNEQMWFGPSFVDQWTDYDLTSAYPTAMAMIGTPVWREARTTTDIRDYEAGLFGFALVEFAFPSDVRYPVLPVRSQNGIIFPLEGRSYCCSPEIQLALSLGCKIKVRHGLVIPTDDARRPFFPFIRDSIAKRQAAKTDIEKAFWKEATNSCYGKTAQGLRDKRTFNLQQKKSERTRRSKITNPFYAACITSIVRAVVGEIMNRLPQDRMVFSVTTDGFITNATAEEFEKAQTGELCQRFATTRQLLTGDPKVCEMKHSVKQLLGWRTRGQATMQKDGQKEFVLAKAGIRPPISHEIDEDQNGYILRTFFGRSPETVIEFQVPISFREMTINDVDMIMKSSLRRISMEYDLKRKPYAVTEVSVPFPSHNHIAISTVPWRNVSEFNAARKCRDDLWRNKPRCMKKLEDFVAFAAHFDALQALGTKKSKYLRKENAPLFRLRRDICRAFKNGKAGFEQNSSTPNRQFADLLNEAGMEKFGAKVRPADVENGGRALFEPHSTPPTSQVLTVLRRLKQKFSNLDETEILAVPAQEGAQLMAALHQACPFIGRLP